MAGPSWLMDSTRIATKIKCASEACDSKRIKWKSSPTRACPNCNHIIDNSDVTQEWPGLPRGVKFDPSDQEIIWHLLAKVGVGNLKAHPFTDEFIPTVNEDDGICYTHPQNLPGVKQDGSVSHFFHRAIKAYNTGTRKRRKIHGDDPGDVRWHKTGKTKPVILDGIQRGCKKIMVLYSTEKGGKPEKTNWVMHQYHLGTGEDEKDGEFVISKVFYQQQAKLGDKVEQDLPLDITDGTITKVDPVTPKSIIPEPPRTERRHFDASCGPEPALYFMEASAKNPEIRSLENAVPAEWGELNDHDNHKGEDNDSHMVDDHSNHTEEDSKSLSCGNLKNPETRNLENVVSSEWEVLNDHDNHKGEDHDNHMVDDHSNHTEEDSKWWEGESQFLLDSQQLVEGLSLCDDLLQSQCSNGDGDGDGEEKKMKPCLSDYSRIGVEELKKDLQECQNLHSLDPANNEERKGKICLSDCTHKGAEDPKKDSDECQYLCHLDLSNIEVDTPPDFRLSQLEFSSQDSYLAWGGSKITD